MPVVRQGPEGLLRVVPGPVLAGAHVAKHGLEVRADGPDLQVAAQHLLPRRTRRLLGWGRRARRAPGARPAFWAAAGPPSAASACCLRLVSCWGSRRRRIGLHRGWLPTGTAPVAPRRGSKKDTVKRRVPSGGTTAQAICADSESHVAMTIETLWRFVAVCA